MPDTSPNLSLPYILQAQAQKHVTHNESLRLLDALTQLGVVSASQTVPPTDPALGERHVVPAGATLAWAGEDGHLALYETGGWSFLTPAVGWAAWVADDARQIVFDGTDWVPAVSFQNLDAVGIATTADTTNRLAVASAATLLSHAGAGHQLKINKAAATDTASLLFQTAWSGRAEMGTAGSDAFEIKVSPDGSAWASALTLATSGTAALLTGATIAGKVAYHRGNSVGTVSASGGAPTGAVVERGANANGDYMRLADGTQICWTDNGPDLAADTSAGSVYRSAADATWTYPAAFATALIVVTGGVDSSARWVTARPSSTTEALCRQLQATSSSTAINTRLMAIGRWF